MRPDNYWRNKLLDQDARLTRRLRIAERPGLLRSLAAFLAHSGDSWFWGIGLAVVWLLGSPDWRRRAVFLFISILILAALVLLVKFSVRRRRPEGEWGAIYRSTDPHSFPSGHAARAAMLAVLGIGLGPPWFGALLVAWAPLVSLARVAMGVHYLSDVAAGVVLGVIAGFVALLFR
jgi:membrane-associated phospholipid phosphatase